MNHTVISMDSAARSAKRLDEQPYGFACNLLDALPNASFTGASPDRRELSSTDSKAQYLRARLRSDAFKQPAGCS